MHTLSIDIETYSSVDLTTAGVYKYVASPDFEILMIAYKLDDEPVRIITEGLKKGDPENPELTQFLYWLSLSEYKKTAYNAAFERLCFNGVFHAGMNINQWECTMVKAAAMGLPMGLAAVSDALNLQQKKDRNGSALIRYFSLPCKPTKANGMRTRNLPHHDPEKWDLFKKYCMQDVEVEHAIRQKLAWYELPEKEKKLYILDQIINDRGIMVDRKLVDAAIQINDEYTQGLMTEAAKLTSLDNPNSGPQLKRWLSAELDTDVKSLTKADIPELKKTAGSKTVTRVLEIRQELGKSSVSKYEAMQATVGFEDRIRGLLQFYGATRTGRWAGRLVQVQNLPQNHIKDLEEIRSYVRTGSLDLLELMTDNISNTLSQLIRTAFVAKEGCRFLVSDFSAIEARVIAWLAMEAWRMKVFEGDGKIYEASAAQMFRIPVEEVTKDQRQKGKVAELALGYQGGTNALIKMGALEKGLTEAELPGIVALWRKSSPKIVRLWQDVQDCAIGAVEEPGKKIRLRNLSFICHNNRLIITLPSGRDLMYYQPDLQGDRKWGKVNLRYLGVSGESKQWDWQDTYGGKLVENIVQAIARDCLAEAMLRLQLSGYRIVMHVHDEVICEMETGVGSIEEMNAIMSETIPWAPTLRLTAAGFETTIYKKD